MSSLEEAIRAWRDASFPGGSVVDALDELHADLALYDTWVAEAVLPYVARGVWEPAGVDVLGALDELTLRAKRLEAANDSDVASNYIAYADLLRTVYEAFIHERKTR